MAKARIASGFAAGAWVLLAAARGAALAQGVAPSEGAGANPQGPRDAVTGGTASGTAQAAQSAAVGATTSEGVDAAAGAPEPTTATLRVQALAPGQRFDVDVVPATGAARTASGVTSAHAVSLGEFAPGTATVRVRGAAVFEQHVELTPGPFVLRVSHAAARNGLVWGSIVLGAGVALAGGTAALATACAVGSCDSEIQTAFTVPMGLLGAAGIGLGIAMLAWHVPEQNEASVEPDFGDDSASRDERAPRAMVARVAPTAVAGGAGVAVVGVF